jgi:hypothetical protein
VSFVGGAPVRLTQVPDTSLVRFDLRSGSANAVLLTKDWGVKKIGTVIRDETRANLIKLVKGDYAHWYYSWYVGWEKLTGVDPYFKEPWIDAKTAEYLTFHSKSRGPLMSVDFFISMVSLDPHYSTFLNLPDNVGELETYLAVNQKDVERLQIDLRALVAGHLAGGSIVADHNRDLNYTDTILGYYAFTRDFNDEVGDGKNVLKAILPEELKPDGSEFLFKLPNGGQGSFLANAAGKQVFEVPTAIAQDPNFRDNIVKNGRSCWVCHTSGLNEAADMMQEFKKGGKFGISTNNFGIISYIERVFSGGFATKVSQRRKEFAEWLQKVNGLSPEDNAKGFRSVYSSYVEQPVTSEIAARWFGVAPEELSEYLRPTADPTLGLLRVGKSVSRLAFEKSFQNGILLREIAK